jgi:hypothetical protein
MKRPVGLRCTICNRPARPQIDLAIATGLSKRAVAERFGVSAGASGHFERGKGRSVNFDLYYINSVGTGSLKYS